MKTSSAKAKGRNLQKYVRDRILAVFPNLTDGDVRSTSMGSQGEDVQLSPKARSILRISIECKSNARHAVYGMYAQAVSNAKDANPVLVIKQNSSKPLVIIDLDYYLTLVKNHATCA